MKLAKIKFVEVFSDGSVHFWHTSFKKIKQITFYEKDALTLVMAKKPIKIQLFQSTPRGYYKSKYKF